MAAYKWRVNIHSMGNQQGYDRCVVGKMTWPIRGDMQQRALSVRSRCSQFGMLAEQALQRIDISALNCLNCSRVCHVRVVL